ncbi:TetR/AcrR family transcriptional regulator [Nitrococcus mobilis]|uniref:Putative transcriptional regulator, TetR family protein n=1 Tax=Nitrococcus mobilis Nb-231 TaxID=314278 RepID=A4BQ28_9GAMM|nr:TetR/AcrR family transcriptional regulator [Nitrococcus mobilis]EAR22183.1 putative transcriptional regulator, TetR family protein [Nitrococcus mobilis Nb-231]
MTEPAANTAPYPATADQRILDTAITLAERVGWEAVRFADVADALGIGLDDIRRHYREKEAIADAWFDRADAVMLQAAAGERAKLLPELERVEDCIIAWLGALDTHRRVTREIILNKLEPGHLHVQIPAVLRISRTVQWVREACGRPQTFVLRALDESVLTTLFVTTFAYWLLNPRDNLQATRRFLHRLLRLAAAFGRLPPLPRLLRLLDARAGRAASRRRGAH